ncbi:Hypothetical Protein FCC1311_006432 [Hondaea fermentalgiana]|uniref:Uncharacterized protein n=1 Tax=Hondaea fermentalgiana TaxID=2315210 RepID=A0A2R5G1M5_9STRA|nr:Hypothetical Protein FCC1311_006432 [Hondaea fermentalgiana]|eukprot:GBG24425.1 Hypothetical Protein FCC1311_006432 [Hondaea fermentalgiana]
MATTKDQRHLYARLGGGSDGSIHCNKLQMARPDYLRYEESRARYCVVCNSHQGTHKIYYEVYGNGPQAMLLLMGLAGTHAHLEPQLEYFGIERGDQYSICVVDNRGIGCSETPIGRWRTTDLASDALQLLEHLAVAEGPRWAANVGLLGFSLGGMVAQELVLLDPKRFSSLTLVSTHAGGVMGTLPPPRGIIPGLRACWGLARGGTHAIDAGLDMLFPPSFLDAPCPKDHTYNGFAPTEVLRTNREHSAFLLIRRARKYVEAGLAPEVRLNGALRQLMAVITHYVSWRRLARLRAYQLEVLVVSGERDNIVGYRNARLLAEALCGKWLHFVDAGHGVSEQHAAEVNAAVEALVNRASRKTQEKPFLATQRKPERPGIHPLQVLVLWSIVAFAMLRRRLLGRFISFRFGSCWAAAFAAIYVRRTFGGFFAR